MKDQGNRDLREYVLRWLAGEADEGRATALGLKTNRFRALLRALHGDRPSTARSRPEAGDGGSGRGEAVKIVVGGQGPLK